MNSLGGGGVGQPSQWTPGEGCQHPPMGVHLKCMIGGCAQNHGGSWTPAGGGVENTLAVC